jgi:hypothetical protein
MTMAARHRTRPARGGLAAAVFAACTQERGQASMSRFKRDGKTVADCCALAKALMQGLASAERIACA